jgi:hypothetical protein
MMTELPHSGHAFVHADVFAGDGEMHRVISNKLGHHAIKLRKTLFWMLSH